MLTLILIVTLIIIFWKWMKKYNNPLENFHSGFTQYSHGIAQNAAQTDAHLSVVNADSHRIGWSGAEPKGEYTGPDSIMGIGDCRYPHYRNEHPMFINTKNVGCGSCIYNPLDPSYDGVLPDWQMKLRLGGGMSQGWKSPPLDSEAFHVTNKNYDILP